MKNKTLITKPKEKELKKRFAWLFGIMAAIFALPGVLAYPLNIPLPDLYEILVTYLFGSFWLAFFFLCIVMLLMMTIIGGLSLYTVIEFLLIFFMAMSIGYSPFMAVLAFVTIVSWVVYQWVRSGNQASY